MNMLIVYLSYHPYKALSKFRLRPERILEQSAIGMDMRLWDAAFLHHTVELADYRFPEHFPPELCRADKMLALIPLRRLVQSRTIVKRQKKILLTLRRIF